MVQSRCKCTDDKSISVFQGMTPCTCLQPRRHNIWITGGYR